jgi:hypothetical protein
MHRLPMRWVRRRGKELFRYRHPEVFATLVMSETRVALSRTFREYTLTHPVDSDAARFRFNDEKSLQIS